MSEIYILFGASTAVMIFALVSFFMVLSTRREIESRKVLEKQMDELRKAENQKATEILQSAQVQARQAIAAAGMRAQEVINASDIFSKEFKQSLQSSFSQALAQKMQSELLVIHEMIVREAAKAQEVVNSSVKEDYKRVAQEIELYKKNRMENVAAEAQKMIDEVARRVLARAITKREHEKLIMKALEEAQKKHVF